ncbi:MAG: hypothetical protein CBC48_17350, partial [bacterium TMED88]
MDPTLPPKYAARWHPGSEEETDLSAFYFPDASASTDLRLNGGLGGALLARQANLIVTNPLEGTVIAGNVTLNSGVQLPVLTAVPEPSSALLLGLGLTALAVRR